MSEGGQFPWKRQHAVHRSRAPNYQQLMQPLPDPPSGMQWIHDTRNGQWTLWDTRHEVTAQQEYLDSTHDDSSSAALSSTTLLWTHPSQAETVPTFNSTVGSDSAVPTVAVAVVEAPTEQTTSVVHRFQEDPLPRATPIAEPAAATDPLLSSLSCVTPTISAATPSDSATVALATTPLDVADASDVPPVVAAPICRGQHDTENLKAATHGKNHMFDEHQTHKIHDPNNEEKDYIVHYILPEYDTLAGLCLRYRISQRHLQRVNGFSGCNSLRLAPKRLVIPITEKARKYGWQAQDVDSQPFQISVLLAHYPHLSRMEAKCYLETNDEDLNQALHEAAEDYAWEQAQKQQEQAEAQRGEQEPKKNHPRNVKPPPFTDPRQKDSEDPYGRNDQEDDDDEPEDGFLLSWMFSLVRFIPVPQPTKALDGEPSSSMLELQSSSPTLHLPPARLPPARVVMAPRTLML